MNEQQLFNRGISPDAAYHYIRKKGLVVSHSVEANSYASQNCTRMSKRYEKEMHKSQGKLIKKFFDDYLNQAQSANAFSWMMIKTAIDEYKQKWRYIEDGSKYIKRITDRGTKFTQKEKDNISLIRYYGQLYSGSINKKYFPSFKKDNLQYWYMKLNDLNKSQ